MRILIIAALLVFPYSLLSQKRIIGYYRDYFGSSIDLKGDFTFKYEWHFDTQESWTAGTWAINNDTIYLNVILIYDTLKSIIDNGSITDSLVLARYEKPVKMTLIERALSNSGWQNRIPPPEKLLYNRDKLYEVKDEKLIKKKIKGIWTKKKYIPWFIKQHDNQKV